MNHTIEAVSNVSYISVLMIANTNYNVFNKKIRDKNWNLASFHIYPD